MKLNNGVDYTDKGSVLQMIKDKTEGTFYIGAHSGNGLSQLTASHEVYDELRTHSSGD